MMPLSTRSFITISILATLLLGGALATFAQDSSTYTVQSGDILDSIAAQFDVQTACLATANNLGDGSKIKPGQLLNIDLSCPRYDGLNFVTNPRGGDSAGSGASSGDEGQGGGAAGASGDSYTVARGDTLDTIGQALNVSVVSLQVANDIGPRDFLKIGQTLVIPDDAPPYGQFPALTNPLNPTSVNTDLGQGGGGPEVGPNDQLYVVQMFDSLDKIGARFDTQVACLAEGNGINDPRVIYPGQSLVIASSCPRYDGFDIVTNPRA
jgi:LysM repeat protein